MTDNPFGKFHLRLSYLLVVGLLCVVSQSFAQEDEHFEQLNFCIDSSLCSPNVAGLPRSKGLIFSQDFQDGFGYDFDTPGYEAGSGDIKFKRKTKVALRLPVIHQHHFKLISEFNYVAEDYDIFSSNQPEDIFSVSVNDFTFQKFGFGLSAVQYWHNQTYLVWRNKVSLAGNFSADDLGKDDFFRASSTFVYGWKKSHSLSYGFGGSIRWSAHRLTGYPVLFYLNSFSKKAGIEAFLPARLRLRYSPNEKTFFYTGAQLDATRYALPLLQSNGEINVFQLNRTDINLGIEIEREIYDWIWVGLSTGHAVPAEFALRPDANYGGETVKVNRSGTWYMQLRLFLVPPRKWLH